MPDDYVAPSSPYITITWQRGTVPAVGVNGVQIEDVIGVAMHRLEYLNSRLPCAENVLALDYLQGARMILRARTAARTAQRVEGTEAPHQS